MSFYPQNELKKLGLKKFGKNVKISSKSSIYNADNISIGDNVRIDDFCIISAGDEGIEIGSNVHIACYSSIIGRKKITISDFANISSRVSIYSISDDFSGASLTNPTIPDKYKKPINAPVAIGRHVVIGNGSIILPGVTIEEGSAIGALSLVKNNIKPNIIAAGIPAKKIGVRKKDIFKLEKEYLKQL